MFTVSYDVPHTGDDSVEDKNDEHATTTEAALPALKNMTSSLISPDAFNSLQKAMQSSMSELQSQAFATAAANYLNAMSVFSFAGKPETSSDNTVSTGSEEDKEAEEGKEAAHD